MSQAPVTWQALVLTSPAPRAPALPHAPAATGPSLPLSASRHLPMAEGQGKLSKPRQPSRVPALFPVPEPGPGGL